ncbi:MAG: apolipoprotein N-acyltransferase [Gammaproteobacteria bacterium]|nr:MAG: apolipoprotein N-acyltransferase [Gammaproteobacteria bacterium]
MSRLHTVSPAVRGRLFAGLAGAALPLSFAPFAQFFIAPVSLAILFWSWQAPAREAAWRGFIYGAAAFAAGTWWLYVSVRLVGGTPLPVAVLLLAGLVCLMAGWLALAGYLSARFRGPSLAFNACLLAPATWTLVEWLRGWVLTGFPWLSLGYGQIDGPLAAWAPVGGVYAVTFATAVLAGSLLAVVLGAWRDRAIAAAALLALVLGTWLLGVRTWTAPSGAPLRVSLVQGAIPQLLKWLPGERRATMDLYYSMTASLTGQDLIVWPEAAIPVPDVDVPVYLEELSGLAARLGTQLIVGIISYDEQRDEYRNSLRALGSPAGVYHKRHLVPFGEFFPVPAFVRSWMRMMNLPYSDITRGGADQAPLRAQQVPLAPTICYEDAYGAEQLGFLPESRLLINVSNDAWFGDTMAPHQHLQMARMRALETGRFLVRSTNTGITAVIDERGAVRATIPQFEPGVLSAEAQPFAGATPYVRAGNYPVVLICLTVIAVTMVLRLRR